VPRGWEDYWGRVRRVQYPTVIDAKKEATAYRNDGTWYTHRTYEADLEFNIKVPYLQVHVVWTFELHATATLGAAWKGYGRCLVYWNDTLVATGPTSSVSLAYGDTACTSATTTQDAKVDAVLDTKYWRGKVKVEYQLYVESILTTEIRITSDLCKAEVGPYQW